MAILGRTKRLAAASLALGSSLSVAAHAQAPRASLVVTRGEGTADCPDAVGIAERVRLVTGRELLDIGTNAPHDTWIQVELVRSFDGLHAAISVRGRRTGTRSLDDVGPGCSSLADALAITLAILLDPTAAPRTEVQSPANAPRASPTQKEEPSVSPHFAAEMSAGASLRLLAHATPLAEAGARVHSGALAFGTGGGFVFPDRVAFAGEHVELGLMYGYLRACAAVVASAAGTRLELCAQPLLGALRGSGTGYANSTTEWLFWSAASALVQAYGPMSSAVAWSVRTAVIAPLVRHGFSVQRGAATESAFQAPSIGAILALGIEVEL